MGYFRAPQDPRDPADTERLRDARLRVMVAQAPLRDPATRPLIDVAALRRVAEDLDIYPRTRERAVAILARLEGRPASLRPRRTRIPGVSRLPAENDRADHPATKAQPPPAPAAEGS